MVALRKLENLEQPAPLEYVQIPPEKRFIFKLCKVIESMQDARTSVFRDDVDLEITMTWISYLEKITEACKNASISMEELLADTGSCKSKVIICAIEQNPEDPESPVFLGTNSTREILNHCPRYVNGIESFTPCKVECRQPGHGEVMAVVHYFNKTEVFSEEDLRKIFPPDPNVKQVGKRFHGPVSHEQLLELIYKRDLRLPENSNVYLYGQEICCEQCAQILQAVGVKKVFIDPETHRWQYERRSKIHEKYSRES